MEENYYRERNVMTKLPLIIGITIFVALIGIILFFIIKGLTKEETFDIEKDFLQVANKYINYNSNELPSDLGEYKNITLEKVLSKNLIKSVKNYSGCNKYNTKLKVCKLPSGKYQYTEILACGSINTENQFGEWQIGTEKDLVANKSDVEVKFLGYKKLTTTSSEEKEDWEDEITVKDYNTISKTTYYRYRDKEWQWQETTKEYFKNNDVGNNVLAYYATNPNSSYPNSDSQTTAYKWYTETFKATEPKMYYKCASNVGSTTSYTIKPCSENKGTTTIEVGTLYTCNELQVDEAGHPYLIEVPQGSKCDCSSLQYGQNCEVEKRYYPSGESIANKETVYYAISPISGAIKDVSTKLNASRYYKEVTTTTDKYYVNAPTSTAIKVGNGRWGSWTTYTTTKPKEYDTRQIETRIKIKYSPIDANSEQWEKISDDSLTLDEFISKLRTLNYNVNSIKEVSANQELKYETQLKYRNRNK